MQNGDPFCLESHVEGKSPIWPHSRHHDPEKKRRSTNELIHEVRKAIQAQISQ